MGATRHLWVFKCEAGHKTEKSMPLGTGIDGKDAITCSECLKENQLKIAYIVFICPEPKRKDNGNLHT